MKFAREYQAHLEAEGYPPDWVSSAVSYSQLKKCVNRVQLELSTLGLDVETLRQLLAAVEKDQARQDGRPFQYRFADGGGPNTIRPELLFVVDGETGEPLDAGLAPGTKRYLHQLAVAEQLTDVRVVDDASSEHAIEDQDYNGSPRRQMVRVPLSSDSDWEVNSIGRVNGDGRWYLIAVLTAHDPGEEYGIDTIEHVSALIYQDLKPSARE